MQEDMHYYGTYAMARAAGIEPQSCRIIATAAQFVDDNATQGHIEFKDGARIDSEATAHHMIDKKNIDAEDQRKIWVPFHFLPGNEGESYFQNMVCRKNSKIAQEMVNHNLSFSDRSFARELIGITAHVYADTFSHHGFSGFGSETNKVDNDSFEFFDLTEEIQGYITGKARKLFEKIRDEFSSVAAEGFSGALGHGAVLTYPDRPYLKWSFEYEISPGVRVERNNPEDFIEGCEALFNMFSRFCERQAEFALDPGRSFSDIRGGVMEVLLTQAPKEGRIEAWKGFSASGGLLGGTKETIPDYDPGDWNKQWENLAREEDSSSALNYDVFRFFQAASTHRNYVLRDLLPSWLIVAH
ncbi:MAG: hypothetical protein K9M17_02775 [Mariprofundaceae bacterium]|nr:hypothetical protein [Mariprofundaceae bacterium]